MSGNTATRVHDGASSTTGTYVLSNDKTQLVEDITYDTSSHGVRCRWKETDTLIHTP